MILRKNRKCVHLFLKSLNIFFKEMHEDRSGEFVRGYRSLKDKMITLLINCASVGRRGRARR